MNVSFNIKGDREVSSAKALTKAAVWPKSGSTSSMSFDEPKDKVTISPEGREAYAKETNRFSEMKTLALNEEEKEDLLKAAKELNGTLVTNDDLFLRQSVDPKGEIYAKTYMESLAGQIARVTSAIEEYYAEANAENNRFLEPAAHIWEKYQIPGSRYFREDMSWEERDMAFRQEVSFLQRGTFYTLNDPYALANAGGPLNMKKAEETAHKAAQAKIEELIRERQEAIAGAGRNI